MAAVKDFDPLVPLKCETCDDEVFLDTRAQRATALAGLSNTTNRDVSIIRQKKFLNDFMDRIEKMLRIFSKYHVDENENEPTKRFSAANKDLRLKDLRLMWMQLRRQDDFLTVAKDHGYEVGLKL